MVWCAISTLDLNYVKKAVEQRSAIFERSTTGASIPLNSENKYHQEDVKTIQALTKRYKLLTPDEKDEMETKYKSGMTMTALANGYGCHHTTVGKILRSRNVKIRDR